MNPGAIASLRPVFALGLSLWWCLRWFGQRVLWGGTDAYEWVALAALLAATAFAARDRRGDPGAQARRGWLAAAASAWTFAATYPFLGDLGRGLVGATGLAVTASVSLLGRGSLLPAVGLAWLSLPLVPLLQLHLGYPLRAAVGRFLVGLSEAVGVLPGIRAEGAALVHQGRWILIDEPCSGVRLLWTSLFLASLVSLVTRLTALRSAALLAFSAALAVLFQGVRTAGLALAEWRVPDPAWKASLHDASGLAAAALLFAAVAFVAHRFSAPSPQRVVEPGTTWAKSRWRTAAAALGLVAASAAPLASTIAGAGAPESLLVRSSKDAFPGWPSSFEGRALTPSPSAPEDEAFLERFRGRLARFDRGGEEIVLAWTNEPSADMHSTAICLRGAGYDVRPADAFLDSEGALWARFTASRSGVQFTARERIRDEAGGSWSDLSAWWWAALLGRTEGPWWKELVVTRADDGRRP